MPFHLAKQVWSGNRPCCNLPSELVMESCWVRRTGNTASKWQPDFTLTLNNKNSGFLWRGTVPEDWTHSLIYKKPGHAGSQEHESSSSSVDLKSSVLSNQSVVIVPVEGFMSQVCEAMPLSSSYLWTKRTLRLGAIGEGLCRDLNLKIFWSLLFLSISTRAILTKTRLDAANRLPCRWASFGASKKEESNQVLFQCN